MFMNSFRILKKNLFSLYLILEIVMHNSNKDYDDEIQRLNVHSFKLRNVN